MSINVGEVLLNLWQKSGFNAIFVGFADGGWQNLVMLIIACVLLYLGIVKKFEPLLLLPIAFGMLLANLPGTSLYYRHLLETDLSLMVHSPDGLIDWVFPRGMTVEKLINDGLMVIFFL